MGRNSLALLLVSAGLALGAALPARAQGVGQSIAAESVVESIKRRGAIRIGLSTFAPWSMRAADGELIGFEPDVGRKLAADMGVEAEFVPTAWDGIIPALLAGKFDVIISGMSITPQRNLTVNFTDPYAWSGMTILANRQLTEGFGLEDLDSPDVTFSARRGAVPATVIAERFPHAELLLFDDEGAVVREVLNGNAHATMASEPLPSAEARAYPDALYLPFDMLFNQSGEGFALRKGDPDALNFFNNWIAHYWRTGWLQERHDYWFATEEWSGRLLR